MGTWLAWARWTVGLVGLVGAVGAFAAAPTNPTDPTLPTAHRTHSSHVPTYQPRAPRATLSGTVSVGALPADRRRSVVYLEEAPRGAFDELPGGRARIDQINEQFVPRVLAVTTGTTVDFPNNDRIYHNVFSLSKARTFDLGRYAAGKSRAVRFDRPGIVRVFCDIHSHMSAWVLVFNHPFFAVTDDDGRYTIANVPPGSYSLAAWYETLPLERRRIDVPASGGQISIDFSMGR